MKPVRGTRDLVGSEYLKYQHFLSQYTEHMSLYGFKGINTPILEHLHLFSSLGDTSDIVSKEMYGVKSMTDTSDDIDTVLRPEGTIPVIRALIANGMIDESFLRVFYHGPMFRYNRPQKGRLREFNQFGCECLNTDDYYSDAEIILCLKDLLVKFGIECKVHLNTLGFNGIPDSYKLELSKYFTQNLNKLTPLNQMRVHKNHIMRVVDQLNQEEKSLLQDMPDIYDFLDKPDQQRFSSLKILLDQYKVEYHVDRYLVRGLDYYRNTVFEVIDNDMSIAGGGGYQFNRTKFNAGRSGVLGFGWAIGYERIEERRVVPANMKVKCFVHGKSDKVSTAVLELRQNGLICFPVYDFDKNCVKKAKNLGANVIIKCDEEYEIKSFDKTEMINQLSDMILKLIQCDLNS